MSGETLLLLVIILPAMTGVLIPLFIDYPNQREGVTVAGAALLFGAVILLLLKVLAGERPSLTVWEVVPGLSITFTIEPLGMMFALIASGLWIANSIYSIGYMRANNEPRQTIFYVSFAAAIASAMGVALAGNLFTLFLFYELLTLVTYPLVTHRANDEAKASGRLYLMLLLGASTLLLLPGIAWTYVVAGTLDFEAGGILDGRMTGLAMGILLALYVFGIAKAAVMPVHFWLPAAMVAPTPVSALLHAVAVVKAGVFAILKIVIYVFGIETLAEVGASQWLVYVSGFTIVAASVIALTKTNLKARLAYSTVSQLSYVVMGAALASHAGILGGGMQIAMHAVGKITLFFCAGAIYVASHRTEIKDLAGIGRTMPITMGAFLIGSLSIIGLPPLGGTWSKWWLLLAGTDAGSLFVIFVLVASSLLNVAYLLSIVARAFFAPDADSGGGIREAPIACLIPLVFTAGLCVALFFQAGNVEALLSDIFNASVTVEAGHSG